MTGDDRRNLASGIVTGWARVVEWWLATAVEVGRSAVELAYAEDRKLQLWQTTLWFRPTHDGSVELRTSCMKALPNGGLQPVSSFTATPGPEAGGLVPVTISLDRRSGPGLYRITLTDANSGTSKDYTHYFGRPKATP